MPKILDRLVFQLIKQGHKKEAASKIGISSLQKAGILKKGSIQLTKKGEKRDKMTAAARAKSRAAKQSNSKPSQFKYNQLTNKARKKKPKK